MKNITFEQIDAIIRQQLILQSDVNEKLIKNLASLYGVSFDKNEVDKIFESISTSEIVIFFITEKSPNENDVSMTNDDSTITQFSSYDVKVIIYGDKAISTTVNLISRLRTSKVRQTLYEKGVHLASIEEEQSIHEFKNNVNWLRSGFTIHINCEHLIRQISDDEIIEKLNTITDKELK